MTEIRWRRGNRLGVARLIVWLAACLIPAGRRREWYESWRSDLWHLAEDGQPTVTPLAFSVGAVPAAVRELYAEWSLTSMAGDVRRAWRRLSNAPLHACAAIVVITIGVSANTAIFSIVNATLIRMPPGLDDPARLVQLGRLKSDGDFDSFSYPNYVDLRDGTGVYSGVAAYGRVSPIAQVSDRAQTTSMQAVSGNFFEVLGAGVHLGRPLDLSDERQRNRVVVLSHAFWQQQFGSRPSAIEATIRLDGDVFTVVGVAHPRFVGADVAGPAPDGWLLLTASGGSSGAPSLSERGHSWLWVIARLAPNVPFDVARDATRALHRRLALDHVGTVGSEIGVALGAGLKPDERAEAQRISSLLMAVVASVLILSCANLAGLLVARASQRQRDFVVCTALGASRFRLVRELLAEQFIVSSAGACVAFVVTWWSARAMQTLVPYELAVDLLPDWRVFVFGAVLAGGTSMLIGLWPARRAVARSVDTDLRGGSVSAGLRGPSRWLAAFQLAISVVLLISAGLLLRSLANAHHANPGFSVDTVSAIRLNLELLQRRADAMASQAFARVLQTTDHAAGTEAAALASHVPIAMPQRTRTLWRPGFLTSPDERPPGAVLNVVSANYFSTLEIPVLRGRVFDDSDGATSTRVAVVSESVARRLWPDNDPIGEYLDVGERVTVIGVVRDVRLRSLTDRNLAAVYLPFPTTTPAEMTLLVRNQRPRAQVLRELSEIAGVAGTDVVAGRPMPLREMLGRSFAETEMVARLLSIFSVIATALAAAGVYVILATWVSARRRELAVRLAIGATPADLRRLVLRWVAPATVGGLAAGVVASFGAAQALARLLFGVAAIDPVTYLGACGAVCLICSIAAYVPVQRASHADAAATLKGV